MEIMATETEKSLNAKVMCQLLGTQVLVSGWGNNLWDYSNPLE